VGTRGRWRGLRWDVAFYHSWIHNELLDLNDALGNPLNTFNADQTLHQGLEAGFGISFGERFQLVQSYALNDFYFSGDPVYGHNRIAGIPEHLYRAELTYTSLAVFMQVRKWSGILRTIQSITPTRFLLIPTPWRVSSLAIGPHTGSPHSFEARNLSNKPTPPWSLRSLTLARRNRLPF